MRSLQDFEYPHGHRSRCVVVLGLMACFIATFLGCDRRTQLQLFAVAVKEAAQDLSEQKAQTAEALVSAQEARNEALKVQLTFSSPETQRFIDRWKAAEREVRELRSDFNQLLEKVDFFFAYAERKMRSINDSSLRSRSERVIMRKKSSFSTAASRTHAVISELESTIKKGNDLIKALEIAGAMGSVSTEVENLEALQGRAVDKMPEIESLLSEGKRLVDVEFSVLEKEEVNKKP